MFRVLRILLLLGIIAASVGCTRQVKADRVEAYPNCANRFDIRFAWGARPTADSLVVSGIATNVRYAYIHDLQLKLSLLDQANHKIAEDTFFFIPDHMARDDSSPFTITLKSAPPKGARLHFLYSYRVRDGNDQFPWTSAFTADAATGAVLTPPDEE